MDPTACLRRILDAFDDGEYENSQDACRDLTDRLWRGGFVAQLELRDWFALLAILEECSIRNQAD